MTPEPDSRGVRQTRDPLILLGKRAGGCTESCSEMHTFSWPCEQAFILISDLSWWQRLRYRLGTRHSGAQR